MKAKNLTRIMMVQLPLKYILNLKTNLMKLHLHFFEQF
jgi:hypothetical protein